MLKLLALENVIWLWGRFGPPPCFPPGRVAAINHAHTHTPGCFPSYWGEGQWLPVGRQGPSKVSAINSWEGLLGRSSGPQKLAGVVSGGAQTSSNRHTRSSATLRFINDDDDVFVWRTLLERYSKQQAASSKRCSCQQSFTKSEKKGWQEKNKTNKKLVSSLVRTITYLIQRKKNSAKMFVCQCVEFFRRLNSQMKASFFFY